VYVTKEQIRQARRVNLADFLLKEYPTAVKNVGSSLCLRENPSLSVKKSVPGYFDFATGEHGNSVDFLTRHLGFSFTDAVSTLSQFEWAPCWGRRKQEGHTSFGLPARASPPYDKVESYLISRGIPLDTIQSLIRKGILYQDALHGNAVFVNPEGDYCEIRGTGTIPFHGCRKKKPDRFWYVLSGPEPKAAFICEAAIDAISLMLIHRKLHAGYRAAYISIGGVTNQQTIDRVKRQIPTVMAVDKDPAGEECRKRNADIPYLIPDSKDWNDDLMKLRRSDCNGKNGNDT